MFFVKFNQTSLKNKENLNNIQTKWCKKSAKRRVFLKKTLFPIRNKAKIQNYIKYSLFGENIVLTFDNKL